MWIITLTCFDVCAQVKNCLRSSFVAAWLQVLISITNNPLCKKRSFFFSFSETTVVLWVYCQKRLSTKAFIYRLLPDSVCITASQTLLCFCLNTVISYAFEIRHLTHCMINSLGKLIFRKRKKEDYGNPNQRDFAYIARFELASHARPT